MRKTSGETQVINFPKTKRIRGVKNLVRDTETTAIIDTDKGAFSAYMKQKQFRDSITTRIDSTEQDITHIKTDLMTIKNLLTTIVERLNA